MKLNWSPAYMIALAVFKECLNWYQSFLRHSQMADIIFFLNSDKNDGKNSTLTDLAPYIEN
jgi:hypothetical protein